MLRHHEHFSRPAAEFAVESLVPGSSSVTRAA
jgi:hypothetical protein